HRHRCLSIYTTTPPFFTLFFFTAHATPEIYTLSLHDALPISVAYVRDLVEQGYVGEVLSTTLVGSGMGWGPTVEPFNAYLNDDKDRKSTRLNSSHLGISYAVFCLKKKNNDNNQSSLH